MFFPIILLVLIIGIIFFIKSRRNKDNLNKKEDHLRIFKSKEDAISQVFFLLSIIFLGSALLSFNRLLYNPFSWQIVLFITAAVAIIIAYYFKSVFVLVFGILGFAAWWGSEIADVSNSNQIGIYAAIIGLSLIFLNYYVLGYLHEKRKNYKQFSLVYIVFGIVAVTGFLFFLSTQFGLETLNDADFKSGSFYNIWQITLSLLVFIASLIYLLITAFFKKLISKVHFLGVIVLASLFIIILFIEPGSLFAQELKYRDEPLTATGITWAVIFNIAVFLELIGLIFIGHLRKEKNFVNLGVIFMFILIFIKYFDWFFDSLDKSVFFIVAGVLLLLLGWAMEKTRKKIIADMNEEINF